MMAAARSVAIRWVLTFGVWATLCLGALCWLLVEPSSGSWMLVLAVSSGLAIAFVRHRRRRDGRVLRIGWLALLILTDVAAGLLVREQDRQDDHWRAATATHLDQAGRIATTRLLELEAEARRRAEAAAWGEPLAPLATPIAISSSRLAVGVSVWREGAIIAWAGEVPGPARATPDERPLIVDHGFRRYLTVSAFDETGAVAFVDVDLGITRDLFPRLGVGEDPGRPLSEETGLTVEVLAEPPLADAVGPEVDRVLGIPEEDPWVWLSLSGARPRDERRDQLESQGRKVAWGILALVGWTLIAGWSRWARPGASRHAWARALWVGIALVASRILLEHARVLDLAFGDAPGALGLLLEPAYFATTRGLGLLRNVLEFLVSAATLAMAAAVYLPFWLRLQSAGRRLAPVAFLALVALTGFAVAWGVSLQRVVAPNANPKLVGLDAPFFTVPFLALHLALFLIVLAPASWVLFGWERWLRRLGRPAVGWAVLVGLAVYAGARAAGVSPALSTCSALLPLLGLALSPAVRDRSFARRVVVGQLAILWLAAFHSQGLEDVYSGLKETVARDEAIERLHPDDNWRRLVLEDLLRELAQDRRRLSELVEPAADRSNAAFELWASSSLSDFGYGSRVELLGGDGRVLSEFDLGLPYESRPLRSWRLGSDGDGRPIAVEPFELASEQGPFLVYRGVLRLDQLFPEGDASAVIIDLPYAAQDPATQIDLSPTGPAALGFPAARELAPRREFDRPVIVARVGPDAVAASSDPALLRVPRSQLTQARGWFSMTVDGVGYRATLLENPGGDDLLVAFAKPTLGDRVLDTSRLTALYVLFGALAVVVALLPQQLHRRPRHRWPRRLGDLGFQERLLGAIVLVVLLPVIVSGAFHERRADERRHAENLEEVMRRLDTGLHLLGSSLDQIATALIGGEYVQDVLRSGSTTARRELGPFELSQVMVFSPQRELLLDESLRDLSPEDAQEFFAAVDGGQLVLESDEQGWYLGRLYPVNVAAGTYFVFVRRQLADEDLGRLARTVGADLTLYDGPWAVVSSQDYLFKAGLLVPVLPSAVYELLIEGGSRRFVQAERKEGLLLTRGYVSVAGPGQPARGVLAARLFARATEAAREQQRSRLFLFGLSSLAFVLAVAVGLLAAGRIVDPIQTLVAATRRVGAGDLDVRLPEQGADEIGQLVRSFNQMTGDLRQGQRTLAARRRFLEAVLGNLSAGVLVVDDQLAVLEANAAADRLLDGRLDDMVQRIRHMGPPTEVLATEVTLPAAEGPRTLRLVVDPIQLETGQAGWLVLFDDVTELLANRRLALYAQMARQVAHEVKNPLTPIQLAAQMVRQACMDRHPRLDDIVEENVSHIERQVGRLRDIASEFSLLGRENLPDLEVLPLRPLIEEIGAHYPSPDGRLHIHIDVEGNPLVLGSREALTKVLSNLVENAMQAMGGSGTVTISAASAGEKVEIRVRDEGPGIGAEVEGRLFEPYFSTKSTGTGLGLVICRNLMEKMGGSIRLENRPDGGGAEAILHLSGATAMGRNDS